MEIFGLILSIPVAILCTSFYWLFLTAFISPSEKLVRFFRAGSWVVLVTFAVEISLLLTLGAIRSYAIIGPLFYRVHGIIYLLGVPSLENLLVLRGRSNRFSKAWLVVPLCTVFAFGLVLFEYSLSETLFGIDGIGGPYSQDSR